jgi:hypothetical protein
MYLNWRGALIMLFLEYFVLLRVYQRSKHLQIISLFVAPLMILIAGALVGRDPVKLFFVFALMEIPLSLIGYKITPDASILERVIIASSFGVVASTAS